MSTDRFLNCCQTTTASTPRRAPKGVYDQTILCSGCEVRFGPWDQYAQELLRDELQNASVLRIADRVVGYEVADWRYEFLKLFFVSLVWRASVSTHRMFERIRLGPYEALARTFLERSDPGSAEDFAVTLAKFDHRLGSAILDPHPEKNGGVNYLRFYLGTYIAYIKVDQRAAPEPFSKFVMTPGQPLKIIGRDLMHSPELAIMHDIVTRAKNRPAG